MKINSLIVLLVVSFVGCVNGQQPAVDGVFNEWQSANHVATDVAGDGGGAFDIGDVSAISSGSVLHLAFDIARSSALSRGVNLQNGPEGEGTLQLILSANERQLTIDFRARTVTDGTTKHIGWDKVGFQCLPTYASDKYEMRIDLGVLGVATGTRCRCSSEVQIRWTSQRRSCCKKPIPHLQRNRIGKKQKAHFG